MFEHIKAKEAYRDQSTEGLFLDGSYDSHGSSYCWNRNHFRSGAIINLRCGRSARTLKKLQYTRKQIMKFKKVLNKIKDTILDYKFLIILVIIWLLICYTNYTPNTFITGWDNLHPEFDYSMNLKRLLTSSWAEYQGLGAPGAHSHASEIPRMLIIGILNLVFEQQAVRYAFVFGTIIIGVLGVYFLVRNIILKYKKKSLRDFSAFVAALFYMLNIGTVQHYIATFEMFNIQYALLPWLIYTALRFLDTKRHKYLLMFGIITFFAAPMAYAVMLWLAYFAALAVFLLINVIQKRDISTLKSSFFLLASTLLINLFWLVPNLYFVFNHSNYVPTAKTNLIFSEEAFLTNQKYGNLIDIFLNKGFLFDWQIRNTNYTFEPIMGAWDTHLDNPLILAIALLCLALIIAGILYAIAKRNRYLISIIGILIFSVVVLIGINPPFTDLWESVVSKIPALQEAIRFPFTKFSILFIFAQTLLLSGGVYAVSQIITKKIRFNYGGLLVLIAVLFVAFVYSLPTFQGNFINKSLRINIPQDYFELFDYFKDQDKATRIANFPVSSLFGWFYTDWGYQGSGFLWYGIEQPILDRDFDRWYTTLENYYDEISSAVYTNNAESLKEVLAKYAIDWIVIDEHVMSSSEESNIVFNENLASSEMAYKETKTLLDQIPEIQQAARFGKIHVYKVTLDYDQEFVETLEEDSSGKPIESKSIFLEDNFGRKTNESFFRKLNNDYLVYNNTIYTLDNEPLNLHIPQIFDLETNIPATISARVNGNNLDVKISYQVPRIDINNRTYVDYGRSRILSFKLNNVTDTYYLKVDEQYILINDPATIWQSYGVADIDLTKDLSLKLYNAQNPVDLTSRLNLEDAQINNCVGGTISNRSGVRFNNEVLTLSSVGENLCVDFTFTTLNALESLYELKLDYRSDEGVKADACIKFSEGCVNSKNFTSDFIPGLWYESSTYAWDLSTNRMGVSLILNNSVPENQSAISYRNIYLYRYALEDSKSLSINEIKNDIRIQNTELIVLPKSNRIDVQFTIPWAKKYEFDYDMLQKIISATPKDCKPYVDSIEMKKDIDRTSKEIRFSSIDGFNCENMNLYNINLENGFLITVGGRNDTGAGLVLNVSDFFYKKVYYVNRLPVDGEFTEVLTVPNLVNNPSNGINIFVNNQSVGPRQTINALKEISVSPIIYNWLSSIKVESADKFSVINNIKNVNKLSTTSYKVELNPVLKDALLQFNQSFEINWLAYNQEGELLQRYGTVNANTEKSEWNNYWLIPAGTTTIYIEYRTQTYQYLAYLVVALTLLALAGTAWYQSRRAKNVRKEVDKIFRKMGKSQKLLIERRIEPRIDRYKKFNKKDLS